MEIRKAVKLYILENFLFTDDESLLSDSDSFLDKGILDSTGILEVIFFLEDNFKIKVEDDEMLPDNLDSIDNLVNYLKHKGIN